MVVNAGYQHPPQGGNHPNSPQGGKEPMGVDVSIQTRAKTYEVHGNEPKGKEPMGTSANPLQIERTVSDSILRPPKASIKRATHNPNARAA